MIENNEVNRRRRNNEEEKTPDKNILGGNVFGKIFVEYSEWKNYGWRGGKFEGGNRYEKLLKKSESNKSKEDKHSRKVRSKWQEK